MRSGFGFYFVFLLGFVAGIFFVAQTHTEIPNFLEMRGLGFFILSVSINKSSAEKFLENKIHECEKSAVGRICPLILDTKYWGYIRMRNRTARFSGFRGMNLKWSIEILLYLIVLKLYKIHIKAKLRCACEFKK